MSLSNALVITPEEKCIPVEDESMSSEVATLFDDFMTFGSVGLHIVNNDGIIVWANQAELDLLGYTKDEYFGKPISHFHEDTLKIQYILTTLLSGGKILGVVAPIRCKDGHTEYVEINSSMRQEDGKCVTTRCFSSCVTDRILKEQAQIEAISSSQRESAWTRKETERKTDFLRKLCHELRNPLAGVSGNLELLIAELDAGDTVSCSSEKSAEERLAAAQKHLRGALEYAKSAQLAAEHQMLVMNDTLSLSRFEAKDFECNPTPIDISKVLEGTTAILGVKAQEKNINLQIELAEEARFVKIDPIWFKQIILNLLSNSLKFSNQGGQVDIRVSLVESMQIEENTDKPPREDKMILRLQVQDTGIGMTPEEKAKLFGLFSQANEMISAKFGGSGLGLHIVKQVLQQMGGTVEVTSAKGVGTTFDLTLPCDVLTPTERASLVAPQNRKRGRTTSFPCRNITESIRILVVDDILMNRKILAAYFGKRRGYTYETAENGKIALHMHEKAPFDIILTDIDMPVMDGRELARLVRRREQESRSKPTPIIGISGNVFQADIDAASLAGINEFVGKPYKFPPLEAMVCRLLDL